MNRKKLMIIVAAVLVVAIIASIFIFFGPGDFRRAKWGMSQSQVKARESLELKNQTSDSLVYTLTELEGVRFDSLVFYKFDTSSDELTQINIGINATSFEDKLIKKIINKFEEKYGEPDDYEDISSSRNYYWNTNRSKIHIRQIETYVLITYMDIEKVAE